MRLSHYVALGAILAAFATGAQANSLLIFNYAEQGQTLSSEGLEGSDSAAVHSIDFLRQDRQTGGVVAGSDDFVDIEILLEVEAARLGGPGGGPGGRVGPRVPVSASVERDGPYETEETRPPLLERATITGKSQSRRGFDQSMFFATDTNGVLKTFSPGQTIDETAFTFNYFDGFSGGTLFSEFSYTNDPDVLAKGETAFIGFAMSFGRDLSGGSSREGAPPPGFFDMVDGDVYFGFIELTRGSITPGLLALNPVAGNGATVPSASAVPLPAGGWLLIAGLGGLAALRRRR